MLMGSTEFTTLRDRCRARPSVAESVSSCREPEELFCRLAGELRRVVSFAGPTRWPVSMMHIRESGMASCPSRRLALRLGALAFGRREPARHTPADVEFLGEVAKLVAMAVENATAFRQIAQLSSCVAVPWGR
jgi:hypothetical protein